LLPLTVKLAVDAFEQLAVKFVFVGLFGDLPNPQQVFFFVPEFDKGFVVVLLCGVVLYQLSFDVVN